MSSCVVVDRRQQVANPTHSHCTVPVRYGTVRYGMVPYRTYGTVREGPAVITNPMARCQILNVNKGNLVPYGTIDRRTIEGAKSHGIGARS